MPARELIPPTTQQAYDVLCAANIVGIVEALRPATGASDTGDAEFRCRVCVPHPNLENLPPQVSLRVVVPAAFPLAVIDVYPVEESVRGFPHQDAETGKLCLRPGAEAPWDITRLQCYIAWAIDWLREAAQGTLLAPGDPYELPDFSRRDQRLPTEKSVYFVESAASFDLWRPWAGQCGDVTLQALKETPALAAVSFRFPDEALPYEPPFNESLLEKKQLCGRWLLLPNIRHFRHRPAQTYAEMRELCNRHNVSFDLVLRPPWEVDNQEFGVLLVGFPIPRVVGAEPCEIHWQPLIFNTWRQDKKQKSSGHQSKQDLFRQISVRGTFAPTKPLPWGKSTNVAGERLFARTGHQKSLTAKTVLCGCGAVGSAVAELLVRGGAANLTLCDKEPLEIGNLCRHTLAGTDVRWNKAGRLAGRLATTNPLADIKSYEVSIPLPPTIPRQLDAIWARLCDADLLIDCTTDEGAFLWLDQFARTHHKRLVSIFFNFGATMLTLCASGKTTSCKRVCELLYKDIQTGQTPVAEDQWDVRPPQNEYVLPGAGCWHPTFPAAGSHVWMLAAAAVNVLIPYLAKPLCTDGLGVLIRRSPTDVDIAGPRPLLEIAWLKAYR